jgi:hypothetical protein
MIERELHPVWALGLPTSAEPFDSLTRVAPGVACRRPQDARACSLIERRAGMSVHIEVDRLFGVASHPCHLLRFSPCTGIRQAVHQGSQQRRGFASAQRRIGGMYKSAFGAPQNDAEAVLCARMWASMVNVIVGLGSSEIEEPNIRLCQVRVSSRELYHAGPA